jgi:hypothetical protein
MILAQYQEIPVHDPFAPFDVKDAETIVGGLSAPSKMPSWSISLDARRCVVGTSLRKVEGSTCSDCYACKGCYNFPSTRTAMERRFVALSDPRWTAAMASIVGRKCRKVPFFRWHDSGDIQSLNHLINIVQVRQNTPHISHWLPTREYAIVRKYRAIFGDFPPNLVVRVSAAMLDSAAPSDFAHTSEVATDADAMERSEARGAHRCPAPTQGNKCGDCRACWNEDVKIVTYFAH